MKYDLLFKNFQDQAPELPGFFFQNFKIEFIPISGKFKERAISFTSEWLDLKELPTLDKPFEALQQFYQRTAMAIKREVEAVVKEEGLQLMASNGSDIYGQCEPELKNGSIRYHFKSTLKLGHP